MNKKTLLVLAAVLLLCIAVCGTLAWLTSETDPVVNTFTVGDIALDLTETTGSEYKMIPGTELDKDPKLTVKADSEACYLFVKIDKENGFDSYATFTVADGWTQGDGTDIPKNVYYRLVDATTADTDFAIIKDNKVSVKEDVTKAMMDAIAEGSEPKLIFTGYAIQQAAIADAETAWAKLNPGT